jgi:hypothetical protein
MKTNLIVFNIAICLVFKLVITSNTKPAIFTNDTYMNQLLLSKHYLENHIKVGLESAS